MPPTYLYAATRHDTDLPTCCAKSYSDWLVQVLVSRPGTSGGWQECILNRFVDANPDYPFRFIQFTNLLRLGLVWDFSDTSRRFFFKHQRVVVKAASCFDTAKNWAVEMPSDRFQSLNSGIHTRRKRWSFVL